MGKAEMTPAQHAVREMLANEFDYAILCGHRPDLESVIERYGSDGYVEEVGGVPVIGQILTGPKDEG